MREKSGNLVNGQENLEMSGNSKINGYGRLGKYTFSVPGERVYMWMTSLRVTPNFQVMLLAL